MAFVGHALNGEQEFAGQVEAYLDDLARWRRPVVGSKVVILIAVSGNGHGITPHASSDRIDAEPDWQGAAVALNVAAITPTMYAFCIYQMNTWAILNVARKR